MKNTLTYAFIALIFLIGNILIDLGQETSPSFIHPAIENSILEKVMQDITKNLPAGKYIPFMLFLGGVVGGVLLASAKKEGFWKIFSFDSKNIKRAIIGILSGFLLILGLRFGFGEFYKIWRFQAGIFVMEPALIILWFYAIISGIVISRITKE